MPPVADRILHRHHGRIPMHQFRDVESPIEGFFNGHPMTSSSAPTTNSNCRYLYREQKFVKIIYCCNRFSLTQASKSRASSAPGWMMRAVRRTRLRQTAPLAGCCSCCCRAGDDCPAPGFQARLRAVVPPGDQAAAPAPVTQRSPHIGCYNCCSVLLLAVQAPLTPIKLIQGSHNVLPACLLLCEQQLLPQKPTRVARIPQSSGGGTFK